MKHFLLFCGILTIFLAGCNNKPKPCPKGCGEEGKKPCPKGCVEAEKPTTSTQKEKIGNIGLYLESSGSMMGYLKGSTSFKTVITDMVATLNSAEKTGKFSIYTIAETANPYPGDAEKFIREIATVPMTTQKSSEMHKIFRNLLSQWKGNDVLIFTSDCILSFPNADIKKNPNVNKENAESTLKAYIKTAFQEYQKQGAAVNIYGFTSPFNGTFYDYKNAKTTLNGTSRPYYVWIIGKKEMVAQTCKLLENQPSFKAHHELSFGFTDKPEANYVVVPSLAAKRNYKPSANFKEITEMEIERGKDKGEEVWIGFTLNVPAAEMAAPAHLKANLVVDGQNKVNAKVLDVKLKDEVIAQVKNAKERELVNGQCTHLVKLKVSELVAGKATLNLSLPYKADNWYEEWSTMDDSKILAETTPKTFAFVHLINGVKEAYQISGTPLLVNIAIPISKK